MIINIVFSDKRRRDRAQLESMREELKSKEKVRQMLFKSIESRSFTDRTTVEVDWTSSTDYFLKVHLAP